MRVGGGRGGFYYHFAVNRHKIKHWLIEKAFFFSFLFLQRAKYGRLHFEPHHAGSTDRICYSSIWVVSPDGHGIFIFLTVTNFTHINPNCKFVLQLYSTQRFELEYINCTETSVDELTWSERFLSKSEKNSLETFEIFCLKETDLFFCLFAVTCWHILLSW